MNNKLKLKKLIRPVILTLTGALAGYLYFYFVGCAAGTCPISSNPVISTIYGAVLGFLISNIFTSSKSKSREN
jgi:glycopeptide antibiotics resistance protein